MSTHSPAPVKVTPGLQQSQAMLQAQTDDASKQQRPCWEQQEYHFAVFVSHLTVSSCWPDESCETT